MIGSVSNIRLLEKDLPAETALLLFQRCELSGKKNELKEKGGAKGAQKQIAECVFPFQRKAMPVAAFDELSRLVRASALSWS